MRAKKNIGDLNLKQFVDLHKLNKDLDISELDKKIQIVCIFTGLSEYTINQMRPEAFYELYNSFDLTKCDYSEQSKTIALKTKLYSPTLSLTDMSVAQMVDFYSIIKQSESDFIAVANELLAVMYKPFKLIGQGVYDPENHIEKSKQIFKCKAKDVIGLVFFYSDFWIKCEPIIQNFLEKILSEQMTEIEKDKAFQDFLINGGGNTIST